LFKLVKEEKTVRSELKRVLADWYANHGFWDTAENIMGEKKWAPEMTYYMPTEVIQELYDSLKPFKVENMKVMELPEWCFEQEDY